MDRRDVLKGVVAAVAVAAVQRSGVAQAAEPEWPGVVYTAEKPGKWAGKAAGHLPKIAVNGQEVTITTTHGMSEAHFIVRHTLVLADGTVAGEKVFTPKDEKAVSTHQLPQGYKGVFYATSFCNMHDLWVRGAGPLAQICGTAERLQAQGNARLSPTR